MKIPSQEKNDYGVQQRPLLILFSAPMPGDLLLHPSSLAKPGPFVGRSGFLWMGRTGLYFDYGLFYLGGLYPRPADRPLENKPPASPGRCGQLGFGQPGAAVLF